ncbi:MAG TPA: enoyl-CoA hydratase, partial [Acidimicrobiaceae bacterium]|nr:enoyl-CoA hydratase [Acidimicrobiaceae bacterium]
NRPEARNAIDPVMRDELIELFEDTSTDRSVRCLVVTGEGRDFCTGADLRPPGNPDVAMTRASSPLDARRGVRRYQQLFATLWNLEVPVVSAVNGTTAGAGWLMALLADLVVAARGARWTHAFTRRGMVPHCGDPYFLARVLPFRFVHEAALLSDTMVSEDLDRWGAVNRVVAPEELLEVAAELAGRLAAGPTRTLGMTKRLYRRALASDMETAFSEEADAVALIGQTDDRLEGVRSMVEGRPPRFTGT